MSLYNCIVIFLRGVLKIFIGFKIAGSDNIPSDGAFLLCANHHSNMDPVLIAAATPRQLTFMAKDELFHIPVLGAFIKKFGAFPIKRGKGEAAAVMATLKILKKGGGTLIFPEGKRMKKGERKQINPGIIRLSAQTGAPIIPAFVGKRRVIYGEPLIYNLDTESDIQSIADELMETIYSLENER